MKTGWKRWVAAAMIVTAAWRPAPAAAESYEAVVTVGDETYPLPVEVESGEVTYVYWPGGGMMPLEGAVLGPDGVALGADPDGKPVGVQIDAYAA